MKKKSVFKIPAFACVLAVLCGFGFFYFSGCVVLQDQASVADAHGGEVVQHAAGQCDEIETAGEPGLADRALGSNGFSILSWNTQKGARAGFHTDLIDYSRNIDILLLQEAALSKELKSWLGVSFHKWLLAVAFENQGTKVGIMAASKASTLSHCAFQQPEPLIVIPKMMLVATYPLSGSDRRLLVVNVHMVNFTLSTEALRRQLAEVTDIIEEHDGPVIFAGDFNTWNRDRQSLVNETMSGLKLQPVRFSPDNRSLFLNRAVDGIYFRGLEVTGSYSHEVESSDHNPLEVHFKVIDEQGETV